MSTPPSQSEGLSLAAVAPIVESHILVDTIEIFRPGPEILDPNTGEPGQTPTSMVYEGPGAVLFTHGQIVMS